MLRLLSLTIISLALVSVEIPTTSATSIVPDEVFNYERSFRFCQYTRTLGIFSTAEFAVYAAPGL